MTCEVCGVGERRPERVRFTVDMQDRIVVIDNVPAEVCNHCGEQTFGREAANRVQEIIAHPPAPVRILEAPVYEFEPAVEPAVAAAPTGRSST